MSAGGAADARRTSFPRTLGGLPRTAPHRTARAASGRRYGTLPRCALAPIPTWTPDAAPKVAPFLAPPRRWAFMPRIKPRRFGSSTIPARHPSRLSRQKPMGETCSDLRRQRDRRHLARVPTRWPLPVSRLSVIGERRRIGENLSFRTTMGRSPSNPRIGDPLESSPCDDPPCCGGSGWAFALAGQVTWSYSRGLVALAFWP